MEKTIINDYGYGAVIDAVNEFNRNYTSARVNIWLNDGDLTFSAGWNFATKKDEVFEKELKEIEEMVIFLNSFNFKFEHAEYPEAGLPKTKVGKFPSEVLNAVTKQNREKLLKTLEKEREFIKK